MSDRSPVFRSALLAVGEPSLTLGESTGSLIVWPLCGLCEGVYGLFIMGIVCAYLVVGILLPE